MGFHNRGPRRLCHVTGFDDVSYSLGHLAHHETNSILAYADKWAIIARVIEQLSSGVSALTELIGLLRMRIAPDKSWTWATHTKQRSEFRSISIDGTTVPMKLVGTELGCDMSSCKKVSNKVSQKRIGKAVRVLKRVSKRPLPRSFKTKIAKQLVTGIAGYGSELVYHTPSGLRTLRTATRAAMGKSRAGNNPYLTTYVIPGCTDIWLALLKRKKYFGGDISKLFLELKSGFCIPWQFIRCVWVPRHFCVGLSQIMDGHTSLMESFVVNADGVGLGQR